MAEGDDAGAAMVTLNTSEDIRGSNTIYGRSWLIPPTSADAFAAAMTERYGQPVETTAPVGQPSTIISLSDGDQL
jgi:hypothetical protein